MDLKFTNKLKILFTLIFTLGFSQLNFAVVATEGGYSNKISIFNGETIKFYISTSASSYQIEIYKIGENAGLVFTSSTIQGGLQFIPSDAYKNGCNWSTSFEMVIPNDWEPGVYKAIFPVSSAQFENNGEIIFAVKTTNLGSFSTIAVILTVNNWNAYNNFGGKSLYNYNSTNLQKADKVSFERPFTLSSISDFHNWTEKLINWFVTENVVAEYITSVDLYQDPDLLANYDVVIDVGHDEYVSLPERDQVQNFVNNGGRLMILSGNTYWWQVRLEDNGRTMVCYKDPNNDPELGVNDEVVTTRWYDYPLFNPEIKLTGVTFREGGVVNYEDGVLPKSQGYGDFAVYNSHYWVYNGTGLKDGDEFGYDASIVGVEVDGNDFTWQNGIPTVTGNDQAPTNFRIFGLSPADNRENYPNGHGIMGLYFTENGGAVFTASTLNWTKGLPNDVDVQKITHNILTQFLKNTFPPEIVSWTPGETISKIINQESVFINDRENIFLSDPSLNFHINAVDPRGEAINYIWEINGNEVINSNSSDFIFNNTVPPGDYTITAYAYNSTDTSQISWNITTANSVTNYAVSGTIVYDNISASPLSNVTVQLTPANGGNNLIVTTDANGNYSFNNVVSGNYDLTATSSTQFPTNFINATDGLLVARYFAGLQTLNPLRLNAADVDNLGGVNATDALIIIRRFANMISTFTKSDWIFETKQISVTNSNLTTQNLKGIATGDVDASAQGPF
ncbi:MAG: carboxypeptidase regulatory-like domain-containing protein [Bacteroidetes bacterium]|nr:carboxypeptidase regulatory-like domain-containing protein [Bacteroidota bacterium]